MITTIDGVVKKPGDNVFLMCVQSDENGTIYAPMEFTIHKADASVTVCYDSEELCAEQCRLLNDTPDEKWSNIISQIDDHKNSMNQDLAK